VRLFLFDIDGTLVTARGAGRAAIGRALASTYGVTGPIETYDFRGKTDQRIVRDLMRDAGLGDARITAGLAACFASYVAELELVLGDGRRVTVLPGVGELVRALSARDDAVVGLLTGNIEDGARVKLRPTGLWDLFRVGAFGSDDVDRRRLPAIARDRALRLTGRHFAFEEVTIIGDTPLDVDCARACGAVAVAVATGFHPAEDLKACAPDLFFSDFADVPATLAALTTAR
jgi:phosphoglycolate phosphatase-like HAD superfamily hydrolase